MTNVLEKKNDHTTKPSSGGASVAVAPPVDTLGEEGKESGQGWGLLSALMVLFPQPTGLLPACTSVLEQTNRQTNTIENISVLRSPDGR